MDNTITAQVEGENVQPVAETETTNTGANTPDTNVAKSEDQGPKVEVRDNKVFLDGNRVYTREENSKQIAFEKQRYQNELLSELDVDSFDQVKEVVTQLRDFKVDEGNALNVESLRQTVAKKEATVEELQNTVQRLQTDLLLKDHVGEIYNNMPSSWNADQKSAVLDLMKARNMIQVENNQFALKNGDEFLTTDGEKPDYKKAVQVVGDTLGLGSGKKGVDLPYGESQSTTPAGSKPVDESRLTSDAEYRNAYITVRKNHNALDRNGISDAMIKKQMEKTKAKYK